MVEHTEDARVKVDGNQVSVLLPMTKQTGKIRLKRRDSFCEYGNPFAARQNDIGPTTYIEWQIGYDLLKTPENAAKTTLSSMTFTNYKGETKYAYELSEIVYYSHRNGLVSDEDIRTLKQQIEAVPDEELLENKRITRSNPVQKEIGGLSYYEMEVSYPLVVHQFDGFDIYAEVINREKQRAVGVQPMLYVCLPITAVTFDTEILGRPLEAKECSEWHIGRAEAKLALELFRVFGMLSAKHRFDVLALLEMLFPRG